MIDSLFSSGRYSATVDACWQGTPTAACWRRMSAAACWRRTSTSRRWRWRPAP